MVEMVVWVPGVLGPDEASQVATVIESERGLEAMIVQIDIRIVHVAAIDVVGGILGRIRNAAIGSIHLSIEVADPLYMVVAVGARAFGPVLPIGGAIPDFRSGFEQSSV
jgi:hypothetical protein